LKQKIIVIIGPTASGKSSLAVDLARKLNGEVISADSRQVYKGLNIGTGKITKREMKGVPHHLLDVVDPKKNFTAQDFVKCGRNAVQDVASRGKLPIVAGGTGFYIDALLGRITLPNVPPDINLRARLDKKTALELFTLLKRKDPERAKNIDPHNKRRLIRALEIISALGTVPPHAKDRPLYDVVWIGISHQEKAILEKKIRIRLMARIKQGLIAEGRRLHARGLSYKRMESFGLEYRALARLLQERVPRKEFEEDLFRDIRRYAKRQMTYWRRNKNIRWFTHSQKVGISRYIKSAGPTRITWKP